MTSLRPTGSGKTGKALAFLRQRYSPRAALVISCSQPSPSDWPDLPPVDRSTLVEGNLGHGLGWTLEIQRTKILLLNPLGEGYARTNLPQLSVDWLTSVRHDGSSALYLHDSTGMKDASDPNLLRKSGPDVVNCSASSGRLSAATVRTAIASDYGKIAPVGRNERCPCGSGKKFKHCHG